MATVCLEFQYFKNPRIIYSYRTLCIGFNDTIRTIKAAPWNVEAFGPVSSVAGDFLQTESRACLIFSSTVPWDEDDKSWNWKG